jgi:heme A synthase
MDKHLKAWRAHRALAWFYGLLFLALGAYFYARKAPIRVDVVYASIGAVLLFFCVHLALARGSLARRPWARLATMLFGFVMLVVFPVGTLIGAWLIHLGWSPWLQPMTRGSPAASGWPADAVRDRPRTTDRI